MMNRIQIVAEGRLTVTKFRKLLRTFKDDNGATQYEHGEERWKVVLGDTLMSFTYAADPRLKTGQSFELILATKREEGPPDVDSDPKHGPTGKAGDAAEPDVDRNEGAEPGVRVRAGEPAKAV